MNKYEKVTIDKSRQFYQLPSPYLTLMVAKAVLQKN